VTSRWGGTRYAPMAFTEHGILMLSSVLNSERAVQVNIQIMRTFTKIRRMLSTHEDLKRKIEDMEQKSAAGGLAYWIYPPRRRRGNSKTARGCARKV
jgi:hypothetical protein